MGSYELTRVVFSMIRTFARAVISHGSICQISHNSSWLLNKSMVRPAVAFKTSRCYSTSSNKIEDMLTTYISVDPLKDPQDAISAIEAELSLSELQLFKV